MLLPYYPAIGGQTVRFLQIGDEIEIPIVSETGKFTRGYVHRIQHRIVGHTQEVFLWVHPWDNYYYKWEKLKEEYESIKRWRASLGRT